MRAAVLLLALTGCVGARVGFNQLGGNQPPYAGGVCMIETPVPAGVHYAVVGTVHTYMHHYGSTDAVLQAMADEARKIGADVIVSVDAGQTFGYGPWGLVRPVATGTAVRTEPLGKMACTGTVR